MICLRQIGGGNVFIAGCKYHGVLAPGIRNCCRVPLFTATRCLYLCEILSVNLPQADSTVGIWPAKGDWQAEISCLVADSLCVGLRKKRSIFFA